VSGITCKLCIGKHINDFKPGGAGLFVSGRSTAITRHDPGITRDFQAWLA
jgi:hypothetical protein